MNKSPFPLGSVLLFPQEAKANAPNKRKARRAWMWWLRKS
jgi:hypothetical protein